MHFVKGLANYIKKCPLHFTLFVMASNGGKPEQEEPIASEPIDPPHLPWIV